MKILIGARLLSLSSTRVIFLLSVIVLLGTIFVARPAAANRQDDVLVLKQDSIGLGMGVVIKFGPDYIEADSRTTGLKLLSRGPLWEVFLLRPSRKVYFSLPYKEVCKRSSLLGVSGATAPSASFKLPAQHTETRQHGQTFFEYKFPGETFVGNYLNDSVKDTMVVQYFLLRTLQAKVPEQESVIAAKLHGLPITKGIPYSLLYFKKNQPPDGSIVGRSLTATKADKPDFSIIGKFTRTNKLEQVLNGDSSNQVIDELFN